MSSIGSVSVKRFLLVLFKRTGQEVTLRSYLSNSLELQLSSDPLQVNLSQSTDLEVRQVDESALGSCDSC